MKNNGIQLITNGKRLDGRTARDMRSIKITPNVVKNAAGSASIEWGNNKIIAAVHGPTEALPRHTANPDRAVVKCRYMMAPFSSSEEHGRAGMNRRAVEISKVTAEVFENVILLDQFPGTEISIYVEVLQSDGGTRAAGITCASVALALSGIPMKDLPYAVSVGKVGNDLILDLDKIEDNYSEADMPVAILPRTNSIVLLQMDGAMTKEQFKEGLAMVIESGKEISRIQKEAIRAAYQEPEKEKAHM
ncbi:MAG: exosome complex exonuclease Rrp41 [Candidatus Marsarchaeota archaeon]|jgi:exosome complex component RRP41|nr:exosome complex exonuclease Rrp41 [Candidatus Marsarchaeota archaeon]